MKSLSRPLRLLIVGGVVLLVVVALSTAMLAFQADAAVARIADALKPGYDLTYSSPRVGFNGELSVRDFRLRPRGEGRATLSADRAELRPPGAMWFLRAAFGSGPTLPPIDRVVLALEGAAIEGGGELHPSLRWLGARSAAPFEGAGCSPSIRFGADDWQQLGLSTEPATIEAEYAVTGPGLATIAAAYTLRGSSRIEHRRVMKLPDPLQPLTATPAQAATVESQWKVVDDGFVAARNRLCGRRARMERNRFADHHVAAVQEWIRRLGLEASPQLVDTYRRYALRGGELQWQSRPRTPINVSAYAVAKPADRVRALAATLQASGKPPAPFSLTPVVEPALGIDPLGAVAGTATAPVPGAVATPGAAQVAAPSATAVAASPSAPVPAPPATTPASSTPADSTATAATRAPDIRAPALPPSATVATPPTPAPTVAATAPPATATPAPRPVAPPPAATASASAPAATASATAPAAAAPVAAAPAPVGAPARPPAAATRPVAPSAQLTTGVADYATLERAVDRRIAVRTIHDTRRVGVLRDWSGAAIEVELTGRDDGLKLIIPKDEIVRAEVLDTTAVPPRAHAKKN